METDKSMIAYKLDQLKVMRAYEQEPAFGGYGAHLTHSESKAKPINLDEDALQALISHYAGLLQE